MKIDNDERFNKLSEKEQLKLALIVIGLFFIVFLGLFFGASYIIYSLINFISINSTLKVIDFWSSCWITFIILSFFMVSSTIKSLPTIKSLSDKDINNIK